MQFSKESKKRLEDYLDSEDRLSNIEDRKALHQIQTVEDYVNFLTKLCAKEFIGTQDD